MSPDGPTSRRIARTSPLVSMAITDHCGVPGRPGRRRHTATARATASGGAHGSEAKGGNRRSDRHGHLAINQSLLQISDSHFNFVESVHVPNLTVYLALLLKNNRNKWCACKEASCGVRRRFHLFSQPPPLKLRCANQLCKNKSN